MGEQIRTIRKQPVYVRFKNNTRFDVEIFWVDYKKNEKSYGVLTPNKYLDVNTFSTHSWFFREVISKSLMVVSGKEIFMGRPWVEEHRRLEFQHPINVPLRTMVLIETPVFDLRVLSMFKIVDSCKSQDDIDTLNLPEILKKELKTLYKAKKR